MQDEFDALDRNTSRALTLAAGVGGTTAETRTYDALGRVLTNANDDYQLSYQYEVNGLRSLMTSETQSYVGSVTWSKTVTKTHDAVGQTLTEGYPSGTTLHRTWTPIGRLGTVSDGVTTLASFTYWGARPKGTTFQNGMTEARTYTGFRGEVQQVLHQTSTQSTLLQLDYAYDANHDRLYERYGGAASAGDAFAYDRMRRLTTAWMGSATPSNPATATYTKKIDYVMDDDGNRLSVVVTPWGGAAGSTPYTTNNLNQYTAVGATARQHDLNGNLKADGQFVYEYDYRNQLIEVRSATGNLLVASYLHDPTGRRIEKAVSATGLTERCVYSGFDTISVYDGANGWKQDFLYGQGIDQVLMLQQRDVLDYDGDQNTSEVVRHFYHRNALGSVMEITDPAQVSAVSYRYDPYGKVTITRGGQAQASDPLGQHFAHASSFYDEEISTYSYFRRSYIPGSGRFAERTPLSYGAGGNLYEFNGSSPTELRMEAPGGKGASLFAQAFAVYGAGLVFGYAPSGHGVVATTPSVPDVLDGVDKARIWPKTRDGGKPGARDGAGNSGRGGEYEPSTNDCDDFATRLYNYLKDLGYDVTFTIVKEYKKAGTYAGPPERTLWRQVLCHCYVDVHTDQGMIWLEAQLPGTGLEPATKLRPDPDLDKDGTVTHSSGPGRAPHEVSADGERAVRTEVYSSPQDAAKRSGPLDR